MHTSRGENSEDRTIMGKKARSLWPPFEVLKIAVLPEFKTGRPKLEG